MQSARQVSKISKMKIRSMRKPKKISPKAHYLFQKGVLCFALALFSTAAAADDELAGKTIKHPVPDREDEICVIPKHIPGAKYDQKDRKKEKDLCRYSFHETVPRDDIKLVGICPKIHSTNPAVEVFKLPLGVSKKKFEGKKNCDERIKKSSKLAKFKQSRSCSYAPAILAYYHFSRALGNILKVPPAVYRTMDLKRHRKMAKVGAEIARGISNDTWNNFLSVHRNNSWERQRFMVLTENKQLWGAMSTNPRGEKKYYQLNGRGPGGSSETFASSILSSQAWGWLTSSTATKDRFPQTIKGAAQPLRQMQDVANMMLMDHILAQSDRFGNVHRRIYAYYLDDYSGDLKKIKVSKSDSLGENKAIVSEMMLRDNDCGIVKTNHARNLKALSLLRHLHHDTYARLGWLHQQYSTPDFQKFLTDELKFEDSDVKIVGENLESAWKTLNKNCKAGHLKLDLDLDRHLNRIGTEEFQNICEKVYDPEITEK